MKTIIAILLLAGTCLSAPQDYRPSPFSTDAEEIDAYAGLGASRDAEQIRFSQLLVRQAKLQGGTVKISTWVWRGKVQWYAQRLIESHNGVNVWRGPNPPMGYHTCQREFQITSYARP